MTDARAWLAPRVRAMQIIALALPLGVLIFAAIAIFNRQRNPTPPSEMPMISYMALAFFAINLGFSFVLPSLILEGQLKAIATSGADVTQGRLVGIRQTTLIIGLAMLEGALFFAIVAYMSEGHTWALAPVLIGLPLMALRLPTESNVVDWMEKQGRRIVELRSNRRSVVDGQ